MEVSNVYVNMVTEGVYVTQKWQSTYKNGNCLETLKGFVCTYDPGFKGVNCAANVDECLSSPCANGYCTDGINGYACRCKNGFTGENCEVNINECQSTPCIHGQCIDGQNMYTCQCDDGFTGENCGDEEGRVCSGVVGVVGCAASDLLDLFG